MITAETMLQIALKQGNHLAESFLEYVAYLLENKGLEYVMSWLERGTTRSENSLHVAFQPMHKHMLQIMQSPNEIDEWTTFGGEP